MATLAELSFFVNDEKLLIWGDKSKESIELSAVSGGGRGQRLNKRAYPYGVNNSRQFTSLSEREKHIGGHRGGPIPLGRYDVGIPQMHNFKTTEKPHWVYACKLTPKGNQMYDRNNFFIHGEGQSGSDGCIVPLYHGVLQVWRLILRGGGGHLTVETHKRHGVDFDEHHIGFSGKIA